MNVLINGDFDIWQRGTSFSPTASQTYLADRWAYNFEVTGARHTITQDTSVPTAGATAIQSKYSMKVQVATADTAVGSQEYTHIRQRIEGYNFAPLAGRAFTVSFWVKSNKTGTYCVSFASNHGAKIYVAEYSITSADTWEKKTITVSASPSAGDWNYTNGQGLHVRFCLMGGSAWQTTAGSWVDAAPTYNTFLCTANQVNFNDSTSNYIQFSQVQMEEGSSATLFQKRLIGEELLLCQRYFQKNLPMGITPSNGVNYWNYAYVGSATGATNVQVPVAFLVEMRDQPTIKFYQDAIGTVAGRWTYWTNAGWVNSTSTANGDIRTLGFTAQIGGTGFTGGQSVQVLGVWTAEAELES